MSSTTRCRGARADCPTCSDPDPARGGSTRATMAPPAYDESNIFKCVTVARVALVSPVLSAIAFAVFYRRSRALAAPVSPPLIEPCRAAPAAAAAAAGPQENLRWRHPVDQDFRDRAQPSYPRRLPQYTRAQPPHPQGTGSKLAGYEVMVHRPARLPQLHRHSGAVAHWAVVTRECPLS